MTTSTENIPTLTDEERNDISYIVSQSINGKARTMNLADPREYRFYKRQLELGGMMENLFPRTHQTLEMAVANGGSLTAGLANNNGSPVNVISEIASPDGQNYETAVLSSIPGGTFDTTLTVGLYDENFDPIGNIITQKQSGDGKGFSITATGAFSTPMPVGGRTLYSIATVQYTTINGSFLENLVSNTYNFPKDIFNDAPIDVNGDGTIKVCLTRSDTGCDYSSNVGMGVRIPIKGSIDYFEPIDVTSGNQPVNASYIIQIARTDQGGDPLVPPPGFDFFTDPNTLISGSNLSWDLDWLTFGTPNFNSGDNVYYIFNVVVQTSGVAVNAFITNAPSSVVPGQTRQNTLKLPPMVVVYGCLAAESEIKMADGSTKPISEVRAWDRIISDAAGTVLTVEDTVEGYEEEPMIRIEDEAGHSLLLTCGHPVLTTAGVLLAKQLKTGDKLITEGAEAAITRLSEELYAGTVYNLNVGLPQDKVPLNERNTTLIANGIVVGDRRMQHHYGELVKSRREEVLRRIPEEWHQDYLNSLTYL